MTRMVESRVPAEPLMAFVGRENVTNRRWARWANGKGLTLLEADRAAVEFGTLPQLIWDNWFDIPWFEGGPSLEDLSDDVPVCKKGGHPLDEANTYIRANGARVCRECRARYSKSQDRKWRRSAA